MPDPPATTIHARLDAPAEDQTVGAGSLRIAGWALAREALIDRLLVVVDGMAATPVRLGEVRPDVADAFPGVAHATGSGFEALVDLRGMAGRPARVALLASVPGEPLREVAARTLTVVAPDRPRDGARPRAAFTIAHDEPVMLPLWLAYYGRHFDADDLFVLAHDTSDGSTDGLDGRCHVVPVHRSAAFDHLWLRRTVEDFQAFLLRSYETVLFAEVDEFVVADPRRYSGLGAYIDALEGPAARCSGFNVVQQTDEAPIRFDEPLLAQRAWWHASTAYSKRLVARTPLRWSMGFHHEYNTPDAAPDPDLMLVHLHRIDFDWCLARHRRNTARDWSAADLESGAADHHHIVEGAEFEHWFRSGEDLESPRERIPEHLRTVL